MWTAAVSGRYGALGARAQIGRSAVPMARLYMCPNPRYRRAPRSAVTVPIRGTVSIPFDLETVSRSQIEVPVSPSFGTGFQTLAGPLGATA